MWRRGSADVRLTNSDILERVPSITDVTEAAPRILLEATLHQTPDCWRRSRRQPCPVRLTLENRDDRIRQRVAAKCGTASEHLVEHTSECPDVGPLVDRL